MEDFVAYIVVVLIFSWVVTAFSKRGAKKTDRKTQKARQAAAELRPRQAAVEPRKKQAERRPLRAAAPAGARVLHAMGKEGANAAPRRDGSIEMPPPEPHEHEGKPAPCPAEERERPRVAASAVPERKAESVFAQNPLLQGVLMSEILTRPRFDAHGRRVIR